MAALLEEANLVRNALANSRRLHLLEMLADGERPFDEIEESLGPDRFYHHMSILEQAGLVEVGDGSLRLTDLGRLSLSTKENGPELGAFRLEPIEIVEVRQLLPCIADRSKSRIIARVTPIGAALRSCQGLFPGSRYSDDLNALVFSAGSVGITVYSTGNVAITMVSSEVEAREILEDIKAKVNDAASKPQVSRAKVASKESSYGAQAKARSEVERYQRLKGEKGPEPLHLDEQLHDYLRPS